MKTQNTGVSSAHPLTRPWPTTPHHVAVTPFATEALQATNDVYYSSVRAGVRLELTGHEIRYREGRIHLDAINDVAFSSTKRRRHVVDLASPDHRLAITFSSNGLRRMDKHRTDFIEIVQLLEVRVFPRLLQSRLQRIDMGLTVKIGKLELRSTGLRMNRGRRQREARWVDFDHLVLAGDHLVVMTRTDRGRHRVFGRVSLKDPNAVLLPSLLPAAAASFR